ncbi:MAG: hypothetical protein CVU09_04345 [Bacteroidetes bacterium HGW-Bacteroidetes-4]|nr:MAG: hypothetical protein CVU09_04345 [Bacteroidetes bacterium HGW-Bacteroidetes-4]
MEIKSLLAHTEGNLITTQISEDIVFENAFASDLMSDVLTLDASNTILITGLANLQTIRTAEMSDIECVIIGRNKKVTPDMLELAIKSNICLIESPFSVFKISGILYQNGIKPLY